MSDTVRMPADDVPDSYRGPTQVGLCSECDRVAHVPAPDGELPIKGHCTGCEQFVRWV